MADDYTQIIHTDTKIIKVNYNVAYDAGDAVDKDPKTGELWQSAVGRDKEELMKFFNKNYPQFNLNL